jgi:hypothetical protein
MAGTQLVKDVLGRVCVLLQDIATQYQRWPEHELVDWLNDAQVAVTKYLPAACSRIDSIRLKPGTLQTIEAIAPAYCIPGDGSTSTSTVLGTQFLRLICNMGPDGLTPGKATRVVVWDILDSQSPDWHTVAKTAVDSYTYDPLTPRHFQVTPGVHASTPVWVRAAFIAQPTRIPNTGTIGAPAYAASGTSTQAISISDEYVDDLVNYVVARANMKDVEWADGNKAQAFAGMFMSSLNAKIAVITGTNPNLKQLPFAPAPLAQAS